MAKIYISSTFEDLKDYRAAAYRRLRQMRHDVISMEDYNAGDSRPLEKCLADVAASEIYVGIFGWRYGYIPDGQVSGRKSITELEYRKATEAGKPRLIFVLDPKATWSPALMDFRTGDGDRGQQIEQLRNELAREHIVRFFSSPEGLSGDIAVAVNEVQQQWIEAGIAEQRREIVQESERRGARVRQRIVGHPVLDVGENFKGRVKEQIDLSSFLAKPSTRLVSIVGRPGIGKTALASKVLRDLEQNSWPEGVPTITVDGIAYLSTRATGVTLESLLTSCAAMLGGAREEALQRAWASSLSVAEKIDRLLDALDDGNYVLLLDHMEELLDDKGAIGDPDLRMFFDLSLTARRGARLLVTSRIPIAFHPDRSPFDRRIPLIAGLSIAEGVALLRDMDPNNTWGLRDIPEAELARAVERLHGIPWALVRLAGLLKDQFFGSPDEILNQFGTDVLEQLMTEAYRRLSDEERWVMDALATLGRPVPLIAAQFVVAGFHPGLSVDSILRRLIDIHMVTLDRMSRMVALNPIDQDYVYQRLAHDGEYSQKALNSRAAEYYAQLQSPVGRWHSTVDLGPYLLEFEHRFKAGQYEAAAEILNLFNMEFAGWRGHSRRLQLMCQRLDGKLQNPRLQMIQAFSLGVTYLFLGPLEKSAECFEAARTIAREIRNSEFERKATAWLGDALRRLGRLDQAIKELSLAVSMMPADVAPQDTLVLNLGLAHAYKGEFQPAMECGRVLFDLADKHDDPILRAEGHDMLSIACLVSRDYAQSLFHTRNALDLYKADDARDPLAYVMNVQGMAYFGQGSLPQAVASLEEALSRGRDDDSPRVEGFSLFNLSRVLRVAGDSGRALEMAELASTVLTRIGAPEAAAATAFRDALIACAAGDRHAMARALIECGRHCALNADLCAPCDLFAEAEEIARAEGLSALAQEAGTAAKELNCLAAQIQSEPSTIVT